MNNTFCVMPFTHLNIKHEGKVSACWRFPDKLGDYNKRLTLKSFSTIKVI